MDQVPETDFHRCRRLFHDSFLEGRSGIRPNQRISAFGVLHHVALVFQACPEFRPDLGGAGERGFHPRPGGSGIFQADAFGRGRTAFLQVGFISFRCAVALDGGIVRGSAPAYTDQQGGDHQAGAEGSHAADGRKTRACAPAPLGDRPPEDTVPVAG
jgi:hypothetical protein